MKMAEYGYVRVSSRDQHEYRQVEAMEEAGIVGKYIYIDKLSGKDFNRPGYVKLVKKLKPGDTLYIKSIDRLGRNYQEIIEQWRIITKQLKADIVVLDMPLLNTKNGKDLTGTLISDIILQLLSYVAQTEREYIRQRQAEGIRSAQKRGVKFGRPRIILSEEYKKAEFLWEQGEINSRQAAQLCGMSQYTFLHRVKEKEI